MGSWKQTLILLLVLVGGIFGVAFLSNVIRDTTPAVTP